MIQNIYFKIVCALLVLFMICWFLEKKVNKYSYEKGKEINKVKIPDIIQESVPIVRNLDVISDLFISFVMFIFYIIFIINGKYQYIIFYFFVLGNYLSPHGVLRVNPKDMSSIRWWNSAFFHKSDPSYNIILRTFCF